MILKMGLWWNWHRFSSNTLKNIYGLSRMGESIIISHARISMNRVSHSSFGYFCGSPSEVEPLFIGVRRARNSL